jgi:hypothetical protein
MCSDRQTARCALGLAVIFFLFSSLALAQGIQTSGHQTLITLRPAVVQQDYSQQLPAPTSGTPPWSWRLVSGNLPAGMNFSLDGTFTGTPTAAGSFRVQVEATDSATTPQTVPFQVDLIIQPQLEVRWDAPPTVEPDDMQGTIQGSLRVINHSQESVDLTVVVVALNEINKAFALGYEHFSFAPGEQVIPFESSVPRGNYLVHVDAIGVPPTPAGTLYSGLQTPEPLVIP